MTSPSPFSLGAPFSLGDPSVLHTARMDRLALGVNFRPSTTALGAVSGIVHGPPGSVGELTLVSDTVLRIAPFVAVLQGTHNTRQGQYVVPNEQQRDLAVVAKDASLFRRSLIVVRVADSQEAGVAPSSTTNGAWIERLDGTLAASTPALPALPANAVALGELSVPSAASGQPVQLTPYNPRTGARHGILPVFDDSSTAPGHGGAPGAFVGEYRDHPTRGLQRWNGSAWAQPGVGSSTLLTPPGGWNNLTGGAPFTGNGRFERFSYSVSNTNEVNLRGLLTTPGGFALGTDLTLAAAGYLPAAIRPPQQVMRSIQPLAPNGRISATVPPMRIDLRSDGSILFSADHPYAAGTTWIWDVRYSLAQPS